MEKEIQATKKAIEAAAFYRIVDAGAPGYGERIVIGFEQDKVDAALHALWLDAILTAKDMKKK